MTEPDDSSAQPLRPCEICTRVKDVVWDFTCKFQYELATNEDEQRRFAGHGGFCRFHTWQYQAMASTYAISTSYPALLDHLASSLRAGGVPAQASAGTASPSPALTTNCALCTARAAAETSAVGELADKLSQDRAQALRSLSAICLPHLARLVEALDGGELVRKLLDHEAGILERLSADMKRFAWKHHGARRVQQTQEEITAAARTLLVVAGHRNAVAM
jgi:hypothetical protein